MAFSAFKGRIAAAFAPLLVWGDCRIAGAEHSAAIVATHDPLLLPLYTGISNPVGPTRVNVVGTAPGYFNTIGGGGSGGADGMLGITGFPGTAIQLTALAVHVTDTAGQSHSLSTLSNPALGDIVNDLNSFAGGGELNITAYPFAGAPTQYAGATALLSAGEVVNGGQPFDLLLVGQNPADLPFGSYNWSINLGGEIGDVDGITALSVTDVGAINIPAIPEPSLAASVAMLLRVVFPRRRRPHRSVVTNLVV